MVFLDVLSLGVTVRIPTGMVVSVQGSLEIQKSALVGATPYTTKGS